MVTTSYEGSETASHGINSWRIEKKHTVERRINRREHQNDRRGNHKLASSSVAKRDSCVVLRFQRAVTGRFFA